MIMASCDFGNGVGRIQFRADFVTVYTFAISNVQISFNFNKFKETLNLPAYLHTNPFKC